MSERDHDTAETVKVVVIQLSADDADDVDNYDGRSKFAVIARHDFTYLHDSAYHIAQFLLENAHDSATLSSLDIENFEYVSRASPHDSRSFDTRLSLALSYIGLPHHWTLVKTDLNNDVDRCETLLHFAARFGLIKVVAYFLDKPGHDVARFTLNRHGYNPTDVAILHGYTELANLLSGFTSIEDVLNNGAVISTNAGCFHQSPQGIVTLTTIPAFYGYTMDDAVGILKKYCDSHLPVSLPSSSRRTDDNLRDSPRSVTPTMSRPGDGDVIDDPEPVRHPHNAMTTTPTHTPSSPVINQAENEDGNLTVPSLNNNDATDNTDVFHSQENLSKDNIKGTLTLRDTLQWPWVDSESSTDSLTDQILADSSLQCVQNINRDLQAIRDRDRHIFLNIQDARRSDLKRLSASCPALDDATNTTQLSPVLEEVHGLPFYNVSEAPTSNDARHKLSIASLARQLGQHAKQTRSAVASAATEPRSIVQIVINGGTDSSSETDPKRRIIDGNAKSILSNQKCWSIDSPDDFNYDMHGFIVNTPIASAAKSLSLASLDKSESECDDASRDMSGVSNRSQSSLDSPDHSVSATSEALLRHYGMLSPDPGSPTKRTLSHSSYNLTQTCANMIHGSSSDILHDPQPLLAPPSAMHKSMSSPAIPDSNLDIHRVMSPKEKQQHGQIQRQAGIEEDEDETLVQLLRADDARNKRMTMLTQMHDSADSEDRAKMVKDEKRRKSGVLSLLSRGSYRGRKGKDRDGLKPSSTHKFVPVSVSNSMSCGVCGKSLANKPALRCEACLLNIHENSCKEQISACIKYRRKVPLDRPSSLSSALSRELATTSNLAVKNVQSFKEKRSVSTPVRTQPIITASNSTFQRSSTSPTGRVIGEVSDADMTAPTQDVTTSSGVAEHQLSASIESLDEGTEGTTEFDDDPELVPLVPEAEAWSVTVDKKVLKKMNVKDIKRQDTIWELIQTEVHHCRALKTLQKLYKRGMARELLMSQEVLDRLFPRLDDLVDFHIGFINQLHELQAVNTDKLVDEIGPLLVSRFTGEHGERMTELYGEFCSQHKESVKIYKDLLKSDRKFYTFIKKCDMHAFVQKREIPAFILLVSQRITKYPILIETILKSTKDKKDRESLIEALKLSKEIITNIDLQVDAYIKRHRLIEICDKIDSRPTLYMGRKFKKSDILENGRRLIHEGFIGLKSSRGKVLDVIAIILSDLILFVQESNQKYTFVTQDTKPSALSLYRLLVREKSDTRDSRGIYLISQNKQEAEMYELVCKSSEDRLSWIAIMRSAIEKCPQQEDVPSMSEQVRRVQEVQEARSLRIREIIDLLHLKDQQIKQLCDEKNRLFSDLLEVYNHELPPTQPTEDEASEHDVNDVLLAAIEEASRLTIMLQAGGGSPVAGLSRSVSSAGEHVSSSYPLIPPVPKRAETFAGFDNHEKDGQQKGLVKKRYLCTADDTRYNVHSSPASLMDVAQHPPDNSFDTSRKATSHPIMSTTQSPPQNINDIDDTKFSDRSSDRGSSHHDSIDEQDSLGELTMPSFQSSVMPGHNQVISFAQLGQYLHTIVHLTAQQGTAVEWLRAQLHEANEKINKLSADMNERHPSANRHSSANRHNQLEELRNLQENINRERQDWEREREEERSRLGKEVMSLHEERLAFENEKSDLKSQKEELQRQREMFQKQIDLLRDNGILHYDSGTSQSNRTSTSSAVSVNSRSPSLTSPLNTHPEISHKRSASAELPAKVVNSPNGNGDTLKKKDTRNKPASRYSFAALSNSHVAAPPSSAGTKQLPMHLLSCTNEQKAVVANKLPQKSSFQQMLPYKLASASSLNNNLPSSLPGQTSLTKHNSTASSLGLVKKLAEPSNRGRPSSQVNIEKNVLQSKVHESHSTSELNTQKTDKDSSIIYF